MQFTPITSMMGALTLRSNASLQSSHLQIDGPASHTSQRRIYSSLSSPSLSSVRASSSRSDTPPVDTHICSVLCMYDFHSDDPDHLPFTKNEILDIVKQGDNGWWAALRKGGRVGWIPEAFVNTLSAEEAEKLRNTAEELQIYEYDAEQLYASAPTQRIHDLSDAGEGSSSSSLTYSQNVAHDDMNQTSPRRPQSKRHSPSASEPDPPSHLVVQRLRKSRDPPPPRSAFNNLTPLLLTNQKDAYLQTRDRAGSLPTRQSVKQRSIPANGSSGSSTSRELSDTNHVPKIATTAHDGLSDGLIKRTRSQKLKQVMGFVDTRSRTVEPPPAVPWALQPAYPAEIVTDRNGVIWGTLDALVNKLTTGGLIKDPIKAADETKYRNAFLMTFRTFTSADTLFNMLIQRYRMEAPDNLTIAEFQQWRTYAIAIQRSVFTIFTMWLADHRLLEEEPHIAQRMTTFLRLIAMPPLSAMAHNIMQTIERLTFATTSDASPKTSRRRRKPYPHKNDLLKLYTTDVADQLTLLEFKLYARVTPQECIRHATTPSTRNDSNLYVFCSTHDNLAAWVKSSILNHTALGKRADTVDFWIKVAEKCKQLNNLSSMSAVINALSSTVITSLALTWAHVGRKSMLDGLLRHNEPTGGFSGYRTLLQNVDGPCVPFIGMYLTDLVHVQDQFSDEDGRICFVQKLKWYETVSAILRYQSKPYDIDEHDATLKFVEERLRENSNMDPNWFWSRSQEIQETEITDADLRRGLEAAGF